MWKRAYQQRFRRFIIRNSGLERRRLWVAVMYVGLAGWTISSLMIGLPYVEDVIPAWTFYSVTMVFAATGALGFLFTVFTSTHVSHGLKDSSEPQNRELDERQRAVWDRASRKAYLIVMGILPVAAIYWGTIWPLSSVIDENVMGLLSLAIFLLALSLPNAIVAWTEPDAEE